MLSFLITIIYLPKTDNCEVLSTATVDLFLSYLLSPTLQKLHFLFELLEVSGFPLFLKFVIVCDCRATTLQTSLVLNLVVLVVL